MAWPLSNSSQKTTNKITFLKLVFPNGSDLPKWHFLFFFVFLSTLEQKKIKKCPWGWSEPFGNKSFKKGILFVIFWFYLLRGHATFFNFFSYLSPVWAPVGKSPLCSVTLLMNHFLSIINQQQGTLFVGFF